MAIFPLQQTSSQRNIKATTAEPLRNEAAKSFEPAQEVVGALQGVAQQWSDANDVMEYTEAKNTYEFAAADIQGRANADPNYKDSDKYYKELEDAKNNSLVGISNRQVAEKASMEMDFGNQMAGLKIDAQFKQKQIVDNKFKVTQTIRGLQSKKLSAVTDGEAMQIDQEMKDLLSLNVASGVLSQEESQKMIDDAQSLSVKYEIYADTATEEVDSQVLKDLQDPKGKYAFLPAEERLSLVQDSQRRIFQNNQTLQKEYNVSKKSRIENIYDKIDGDTLVFADIDAEKKIPADKGGIPSKTLQIIEKGQRAAALLKMPAIAENHDDAVKYINAMTDYVDNIDDQNKIMEYIAKAYEVGGLNAQEAKFLEGFQGQAMGIKGSRDRAKFMQNNFIPFKNAINAISEFWTGIPTAKEEDHALTIRSMIIGVTNGIDPIQAKNEAILEAIRRRNPNVTSFPKEGQRVMDAQGNIKTMLPDGSVKGEVE